MFRVRVSTLAGVATRSAAGSVQEAFFAPTAAGSSTTGGGHLVGPLIGVRVGGSPVEYLDRLAFVDSWALAEHWVALAEWLRAEGEQLSDQLFPVIGCCSDGGLKPRLVALRRAVFQGKRLSARLWSQEVRRSLPVELADRVGAWAREADRAKALEARLPETIGTEISARTRALREAVGGNGFRFGLLLGSSTLADALRGWLDEPAAATPSRRVLLSAAKYLARTVAKTSPYASFTLSGLGRWVPAGPVSEVTDDLDWCGVVELDRRVVKWIWQCLVDRPEFREHVGVRVNPAVTEDGGQLRFLGAGAGEPVVGVAATEKLRQLVDHVRNRPLVNVGELARHLVDAGDTDMSVSFVGQLIELGLLELCRPFTDQDPDPLGTLVDGIGPHEDPPRRLRAAVAEYPSLPDVDTRTRRLRYIRELIVTTTGRSPEAVPTKGLVMENALITHPVVRLGADRWRQVLDDLSTLRNFLGIFNPHLPVQAQASAFFIKRYPPGRSVGFLEFYREFHSGGMPSAEPAAELVALRRAAVAALYPDGGDDVVRVDLHALAELAAAWPANIRSPTSICCYGHELPGPQFVLNAVRTGYGCGINRIYQLITQSGRSFPMTSSAHTYAGEPKVLFAECRATFDSNLNLRPAAVPFSISYPGVEQGEDTATRISMAELDVDYDVATTRLMLRRRDGVEVRPLALGMLAEHMLPPALYFLIRLFGEPQLALVPERQLSALGWRTGANGVRQRPRVRAGAVVLVRAAWSIDARRLPVRAKGETDAAHLLRVVRWRREHGIPRRCFVSVRSSAGGTRSGWLPLKSRKPLYLDFANWFLLIAVERSIANLNDPGAVVIFEEALPDPAEAPRYGKCGRRVTEYIIELSAAAADA